MKVIESAANPAVRRLIDLRKRRHRADQGVFLIEGIPELRRAIDAGIQIESLFITDEPHPDLTDAVHSVARLRGPAADRAFVRERGGDVIAVARSPGHEMTELADADFVVLAESIEKPGNLGAMLRSADATGVGAFIVCDPTTDPLNPNVIRASLGTVFTVPLAVCSLAEAVAWCRDRSVAIAALDPTGTALYDTDMRQPVAVAVGTEHEGISPALRTAADLLVAIPMAGTVDSLNAATALAIGLYEAVRQRR